MIDSDLRTLHIRCGSDIRDTLRQAGFQGDFHEHSYPYLIGPVHEGEEADGSPRPGVLEERARFISSRDDSPGRPLEYAAVLDGLRRDEQTLRDSSGYERVVIWSEYDCYDQLVLVRLLGHYARRPRPPHLELINVRDYPGIERFLGLGQLPPEALRELWPSRETATVMQLALGLAAWNALASADPTGLAALVRSGTPDLPLLAPALQRHLAELPSTQNGLSLTEAMVLELLAEEPHSLNRLFGRLTHEIDPLPGQGDSQLRDRVLDMEAATDLVFTREPGLDSGGRSRPPWTDVLTITGLGRRVLAGDVDFTSLDPPARWVGGVEIRPGERHWRWDAAARDCYFFGSAESKSNS